MKDNFSIQAKDYSRFRPHYPDKMIAHLLSFVSFPGTALDVATGNGQVAIKLAEYFTTVFATDISDKQLENAVRLPNVIYSKQPAEKTDFDDSTFDLITVAQAVHWFKFTDFYNEIYRILKPEGVFAVLGYGLFSTNKATDEILLDYYHNIVGPYWDAERKYLDENYETIPFPFDELASGKFSNKFTWSFEHLIGYLETWSATQHYKNRNNHNPIDIISDALAKSWEASDRQVYFPLLMRIGKLKKS